MKVTQTINVLAGSAVRACHAPFDGMIAGVTIAGTFNNASVSFDPAFDPSAAGYGMQPNSLIVLVAGDSLQANPTTVTIPLQIPIKLGDAFYMRTAAGDATFTLTVESQR